MKRQAIYRRLVRRYIDNKASDIEREVFFHLLASGKLEKHLDTELQADADKFLNKVSIIPRYLVAAAIIGLVALSGILWWSKSRKPPAQPLLGTYYKNEVPPGGNHAVLRLANGSYVVLDSAGKGSLGIQGGAQVTKVTAGSLSYHASSKPPSLAVYNTITTPVGGQYRVTLADGTRVWLDALSTFTFPTSFTGDDRTVEVTGEAYFEVAVNRNKPFHVHVNGVDVEVLGTHFNVNAYADEGPLKTTLLEGAVRLKRGTTTLLLAPGEQAQTEASQGFSLVKGADVKEAVAWKDGYFSFDDATIQTVMRQLSRWYDIQVRYEGTPTQALFWGKMGRDLNLTQVLTGLSKSKVHFQLDGSNLTVLP